MKVQLKPRSVEVQPWEGTSPENAIINPKYIRAGIGRDLKYQVAIPEDRLKELAEETGYNLDLRADPEKAHEFWDESAIARVKVENKSRFFDTSKPVDEIRLGILKGSEWVAGSLSEAEGNPLAQFVIYSEEEESSKRASKVDKIQEAYVLSYEMSRKDKDNILRITLGRKFTSDSGVNVAISDLIQDDVDEFLRWAKADKAELNIRALVMSAIDVGHIHKDGAQYRYGDVFLGIDIDEVMKTLSADENQSIVVRLREKMSV